MDDLCRICMGLKQPMRNLLETDFDLIELHVKLYACFPTINIDDRSFPKTICEICVKKLQNAYKFRELCLKSTRIFIQRNKGEYLSKNNNHEVRKNKSVFITNTDLIPNNELEENTNKQQNKSIDTSNNNGIDTLSIPHVLHVSDSNGSTDMVPSLTVPVQNIDCNKDELPHSSLLSTSNSNKENSDTKDNNSITAHESTSIFIQRNKGEYLSKNNNHEVRKNKSVFITNTDLIPNNELEENTNKQQNRSIDTSNNNEIDTISIPHVLHVSNSNGSTDVVPSLTVPVQNIDCNKDKLPHSSLLSTSNSDKENSDTQDNNSTAVHESTSIEILNKQTCDIVTDSIIEKPISANDKIGDNILKESITIISNTKFRESNYIEPNEINENSQEEDSSINALENWIKSQINDLEKETADLYYIEIINENVQTEVPEATETLRVNYLKKSDEIKKVLDEVIDINITKKCDENQKEIIYDIPEEPMISNDVHTIDLVLEENKSIQEIIEIEDEFVESIDAIKIAGDSNDSIITIQFPDLKNVDEELVEKSNSEDAFDDFLNKNITEICDFTNHNDHNYTKNLKISNWTNEKCNTNIKRSLNANCFKKCELDKSDPGKPEQNTYLRINKDIQDKSLFSIENTSTANQNRNKRKRTDIYELYLNERAKKLKLKNVQKTKLKRKKNHKFLKNNEKITEKKETKKADFTTVKISEVKNDTDLKYPYVCDLCNIGTQTMEELEIHLTTHIGHENDKQPELSNYKKFTCKYCDRTCQTKMGIRVHQSRVHNTRVNTTILPKDSIKLNIECFICEVCKKEFPSKRRWTTHKKVHN